MKKQSMSRRSALRGLGFALGTGVVGLDWAEMARAAHAAHQAAAAPGPVTLSLLGAADGADVEALTSNIVPSDDTPGAREAGVTYFIDRALATFFAHWRPGFMRGLSEFQAACRARHPDVASFAALAPNLQLQFLRTVEGTSFFEQTRTLTLCAMLSLPKYGGNRESIGWKMLGFEDQHVFEPPFGYYDRDIESGGGS